MISGFSGWNSRSTAPTESDVNRDAVPVETSVRGAVDPPRVVVLERVAHRRRVHQVRVARVGLHGSDLARVLQSDVFPRLPGVGRLMDALADDDVRANPVRARTHVDDVRVPSPPPRCDRWRETRSTRRRCSPSSSRSSSSSTRPRPSPPGRRCGGCERWPSTAVTRPPRDGPTKRNERPPNRLGSTVSALGAEAWTPAGSPEVPAPSCAASESAAMPTATSVMKAASGMRAIR